MLFHMKHSAEGWERASVAAIISNAMENPSGKKCLINGNSDEILLNLEV